MSVTYRQPVGRRRPLHVGRLRYGGLWFRHRLRPLTTRLASVAAPLTAPFGRLRPGPLADGPLLGVLVLGGLGALVAACLLGMALASWAATSPEDTEPAVLGAIIVGAVFFGLSYLVFASGRGRPERARKWPEGTLSDRDGGPGPSSPARRASAPPVLGAPPARGEALRCVHTRTET